jgi:hypothetical protein
LQLLPPHAEAITCLFSTPLFVHRVDFQIPLNNILPVGAHKNKVFRFSLLKQQILCRQEINSKLTQYNTFRLQVRRNVIYIHSIFNWCQNHAPLSAECFGGLLIHLSNAKLLHYKYH